MVVSLPEGRAHASVAVPGELGESTRRRQRRRSSLLGMDLLEDAEIPEETAGPWHAGGLRHRGR
jgi:hypothetical protein